MGATCLVGLAVGAVIGGVMVLVMGLFFPDKVKYPRRAVVVGILCLVGAVLAFLLIYEP
jgi:H+/Cl- antiporter ClcA